MTMKMSSRGVALCAVLGVLVAPACVIKIGPGTSGETTPDPTTGAGAGGAAATWTPEELAAFDAIQNADPNEVAKVTGTAAFAAVSASNLIATQMVDPAALDAASASQLVDSVAPAAIDAALTWAQSVDLSAITPGYSPKYECGDPPNNCPYTTKCVEFPGWVCSVTGCGQGSCPDCPEFLQNLIIKGWCAYGCMKGTEITGGAFILQTQWAPNGPFCFPK
jgi:hypothetical protein